MERSGDIEMRPARLAGRVIHLPPPGLRPAAHQLIGRRLKLYYEELQQQPLPDRLAGLLDQLDHAAGDLDPRRRDEDGHGRDPVGHGPA